MLIITEDNGDDLEMITYMVQRQIIADKYGLEVAENANYGWAVDGGDDWVGVCTKVYLPDSRPVLLDSEAHSFNEIKHEWLTY